MIYEICFLFLCSDFIFVALMFAGWYFIAKYGH